MEINTVDEGTSMPATLISFTRNQLPGTLENISEDHLNSICTVGLMIGSSVLQAISALCENLHFEDFRGFEDPADIFNLFPEARQRILSAVADGKQVLQIMSTGSKHFVLAHYQPSAKRSPPSSTPWVCASRRSFESSYILCLAWMDDMWS